MYGTFPRIWGIGALTDQLVAGLIMKLVGGLILWGVIAAIFFRWYRQERHDGAGTRSGTVTSNTRSTWSCSDDDELTDEKPAPAPDVTARHGRGCCCRS